jgi:tRNA threonylcarbamoyladenosine biosynthesis protein TsaE
MSISMKKISSSPSETTAIAAQLAQTAQAGDIICLHGSLGAGKTTFVQGFSAAMGYHGAVTSPTFTLVNEYHGGRLPIYHFDLYRLDSPPELETIGAEEYFYSHAICLIEWAENGGDYIPPATHVHISHIGDDREIRIDTGN